MEPPTRRTVTIHGHELSYLDSGTGSVVLFIHGILGSQRQWTHLIDRLHDDHRVIVPDLFGHGESDKPVGDYSLGAHAATMRDLLDRLGIERVTLVGHSLGGGIAMEFYYLFPERVERLVLVASGGLGREVNPILRSATLPGAGWVLPILASGGCVCAPRAPGGPCQGGLEARHGHHHDLAGLHLARGCGEPARLPGHDPRRHRPRGPDCQCPRLPARRRADPDTHHLGLAGPDDPGLARDHCAEVDPGLSHRAREPATSRTSMNRTASST